MRNTEDLSGVISQKEENESRRKSGPLEVNSSKKNRLALCDSSGLMLSATLRVFAPHRWNDSHPLYVTLINSIEAEAAIEHGDASRNQ